MDNKSPQNDLARAHIQIQYYHQRWDPLTGLRKGTVFPELFRPYHYEDRSRAIPDEPGRTAKARGGKRHG